MLALNKLHKLNTLNKPKKENTLEKMGTHITRSARAAMSVKTLSVLALLLVAVVEPSWAQTEFALPQVDIAGVDADSTATEIVTAIIKYAFSMALWIFVLIAGAVFIKNTVKSVAKVRKDEDGKWGDVIGEITGNAVVVILIIALATWVTGLLN
jgi:ribosome biogenesis protein Tsr3